MKRLIKVLVVCLGFWGGWMFATVNAMMGVSITTASTITGVTPVSAVLGQTVASGGGGGFAPAGHLEYSPNGGSLTTGPGNFTGATLLVVFTGTYKDWYATDVDDSNGNTYTPRTLYAGGAQAGQFWYCINPTGNLSALTFTITGVSGNINLYSFFGAQGFSGEASPAYDTESGALDSTDPLQPGSITPSQNNALVLTAIFNYNVGGAPTCAAMTAFYGVAKSGNIGMGGNGYVVQGTAAPIDPTVVSAGAGGNECAVVQIAFIP